LDDKFPFVAFDNFTRHRVFLGATKRRRNWLALFKQRRVDTISCGESHNDRAARSIVDTAGLGQVRDENCGSTPQKSDQLWNSDCQWTKNRRNLNWPRCQ
jgi:hypothetical protein